MGLEEKTISSSGCTSGSAELVSHPNNILFSNDTYRFLIFLLLMLLSVRTRHIDGAYVPFKVVEIEGMYLKQSTGNNECEFYVMWAMLRYIGGKSEETDKLVCIITFHLCLLIIQQNDLLIHLWISSFLNDNTRNITTKGG